VTEASDVLLMVEASADDVGVLPIALREESMALASAGETVVVEGLP